MRNFGTRAILDRCHQFQAFEGRVSRNQCLKNRGEDVAASNTTKLRIPISKVNVNALAYDACARASMD